MNVSERGSIPIQSLELKRQNQKSKTVDGRVVAKENRKNPH
jgi:hypothetical protein